jgi:hypothetical protein
MSLFLAERTVAVDLPLPAHPPKIWSGADCHHLQSPMGTADVGVGHLLNIRDFSELIASPRTVGDRMVMFSIAVLLFCFSISNPSTRIFVAVTLVMVAALVWWCIKSSWESSEERGWASSSLRSYFCRALDHIRGVANGFFALILRRESSPLLPYGHSGNLQVIPDHERVDV